MLRTIHLYGPLAERTGVDQVELDVDSNVMLVRGLTSQVPNFREAMLEHPEMYILLSDSENQPIEFLDEQLFAFPISAEATHIHLVPKVEGAGVELALAAIYGAATTIATATAVQIAVAVAVNIAAMVVVGAVITALAPSPNTSAGGQERAEETPSFLFNGAVNVIEQGYPVPLVYGTHMTGSIVISAGVTVEEIPVTPVETAEPPNGGGTSTPAAPGTESWQWAT